MATALSLGVLAVPTVAAPLGSFDPTYGVDGHRELTVAGADLYPVALVKTADGHLLVLAHESSVFRSRVFRLTAGGELDLAWGDGDGVAEAAVAVSGPGPYGAQLALTPQGDVIVAGTDVTGHAAVAKLSGTDGGVVAAFGAGGIAAIPDGAPASSVATAVAVRPDGRIVAAGPRSAAPSYDLFLAELDTTGAPTTSFAPGGTRFYDQRPGAGRVESANDMVLRDDGSVLLAVGEADIGDALNDDSSIERFTATGTRDLTYGNLLGGARFTAGTNTAITALEATPANDLWAGGYTLLPGGLQTLTSRLTTTGQAAVGFPTGGRTTAVLGTPDDFTVLPDDSVLAVGGRDAGGGPARAMAQHILPDGTPDPAFPAGGGPGAGVKDLDVATLSAATAVVRDGGRVLIASGDASVPTASGDAPVRIDALSVAADPEPGPGPDPGPDPGPGGGEPPQIIASTAPPVTGVPVGKPAILGLTLSAPATELDIRLTVAGKPVDTTCQGAQTEIGVYSAQAGTITGTVTPVGTGGKGQPLLVRTKATTAATARGAQAAAAPPSKAIRKVTPTVTCAPPAGATVDVTAQGGPPEGCAASAHVDFFEITGCLRRVTRMVDIPTSIFGPSLRGSLIDWFARNGIRDPGTRDLMLSIVPVFTTGSPARLNGIDFTPAAGSNMLLALPFDGIIAASKAKVAVGKYLLRPMNGVYFSANYAGLKRYEMGYFDVGGTLAGFDVASPFGVFVDAAGVHMDTTVRLPKVLSVGGGPATSPLRLDASTSGGLKIPPFTIGPLSASFAGAGLEDLRITYRGGSRERWEGGAKLCLPEVFCLDGTYDGATGNGVVVEKGELASVRARVDPAAPIVLGPGITLDSFGAGFAQNPLRFTGTAQLSFAKLVRLKGGLVLAFPTTRSPFYPSHQDFGIPQLPTGLSGIVDKARKQRNPFTTFTIAAAADVFVSVPVAGDVKLGSGYVLYNAPGYIAFGGEMQQDFLGVVTIKGGVTGEFNFTAGRFNVTGQVQGCIEDLGCLGIIGAVSNVGVGGCAEIGPVMIGGGVTFYDGAVHIWVVDGCKWTRFTEDNVRTRALRGGGGAGGPVTIDVKEGDPSRTLEFQGDGGAPLMRVTGPGGQTLNTPSKPGFAHTDHLLAARSDTAATTWIGLHDPPPGRYTVTPVAGSPEITKVMRSVDQAPVKGSGTVSGGAGLQRTLRYTISTGPGQHVTFVESTKDGGHEIGRIDGGGSGRLRFTTTPGKAPRSILARVDQGGPALETIELARFRPPPPALPAVARVSVRRRDATVRASWPAVAGAGSYEVVLRPTIGAQRTLRTTRRSATFTRLSRVSSGRVTVRAVDPLRVGAAAGARYRWLARPTAAIRDRRPAMR